MDKTKLGWAHEHFAINYSKLRIFEFDEYNTMGVLDCFCEWHHSPQYKIGYYQQCPDRVKWTAEMGPPPSSYFNTGMFIFEPSQATYDDLMNTIKITPPSSFAEQDLLNLYFRSIFKPIPPVYNLLLPMPWRYTGKDEHMDREDVKMLVKKWWEGPVTSKSHDASSFNKLAHATLKERTDPLRVAHRISTDRIPTFPDGFSNGHSATVTQHDHVRPLLSLLDKEPPSRHVSG
ncbi:hypothetical protein POM88_003367 [Heracleum sosnowskyi]|uniref:Hexosyltransferase n=1 Tax=Heracleum sosnowskyi TaxID=360622 RepID=A0AAD8JG77_9APIA|nr:hypothetical protein POM88_003367 [Heracleum sosnowskyi]